MLLDVLRKFKGQTQLKFYFVIMAKRMTVHRRITMCNKTCSGFFL